MTPWKDNLVLPGSLGTKQSVNTDFKIGLASL